MFIVEFREELRRRLVGRARQDPRIVAAAVTGSAARKTEDRWSDIDLLFGVSGVIPDVLDDWTAFLFGELGAIHHFDLFAGPATYRVFLLDDLMEVDLGFTPAGALCLPRRVASSECQPRGRARETPAGGHRQLTCSGANLLSDVGHSSVDV